MSRHKRRTLYFPLIFLFLGLFLAILIFGGVRCLMLTHADDGVFRKETLFRVLWETVPALSALFCAAVGTAISLCFQVTKPLRRLAANTSGLSSALADGKIPERVEADGNLGKLSDTLSAQEEEMLRLLERVRLETAETTERETRLAVARAVLGEYPEKISFGAITYGVCARAKRSEQVGADFTDALPLDRSRIFLAAADVWGKGLPAALYATRLRGELRRCVLAGRSLAETLAEVNGTMSEYSQELAATVFVCIFSPETGELTYANAGHYAPLVSGERIGFLRVRPGIPLGAYAEFTAEEQTIFLRPGQGLVLYTDGVCFARKEGKAYGFDRLLQTARGCFDSPLGADYIAEEIFRSVGEFSGAEGDAAVAALYYPNGVHRIFRPDPAEAENVRAILLEWLPGDPRRKKIALICGEIFENIVERAGASSIQMSCMKEENKLLLRFTDDGESFDPFSAATEERNPYDLGEGLALPTLRQISGEMFYRTRDNLNILTIRFPLIQSF